MMPTVPMTVTSHTNPANKECAPFSRPSHFALILVPVLMGIAYSYGYDTAATAPRLLLALFLFTLGLGAALSLLWGVQLVEQWEERNARR